MSRANLGLRVLSEDTIDLWLPRVGGGQGAVGHALALDRTLPERTPDKVLQVINP